MGKIETKLAELGLVLPPPLETPPHMRLPFAWVRIRGHRAYIAGHLPQNPDGSIAQPLGQLGAEVTTDQGYQAARLVALAHLGSLKRALGDLDRVTAWLRFFAVVNEAPGFTETPNVVNGYSDLILELFGPEAGMHTRSLVGARPLLNVPVYCEAEVEIDGG